MSRRHPYNFPKYIKIVQDKYIVYRPRIPVEKRHLIPSDKYGYLKPPVRIGTVGQSEDLILRNYLAAKSELDNQSEPDRNTLFWISKQYHQSRQFRELSSSTQKHYLSIKVLDHPITRNGESALFGNLLAAETTKPIMQSIMEKRLAIQQEKGNKGQAVINYEARYVSSMLAWACNFIPNLGIHQNPLIGLKRPAEPKNDRYVTDREYNTQLRLATGYLPIYFELAYLCAARKGEVRNLKISDVLDNGLQVSRHKGSKTNIVAWTPRLRAAVELAKKLRAKAKVVNMGLDQPLLVNAKGEKIRDEGIKSAMSRLKKKMKSLGLESQYWSLHLLKHKGMSDAENKDLGGHKTQSMKDNYNHILDVIKAAK